MVYFLFRCAYHDAEIPLEVLVAFFREIKSRDESVEVKCELTSLFLEKSSEIIEVDFLIRHRENDLSVRQNADAISNIQVGRSFIEEIIDFSTNK